MKRYWGIYDYGDDNHAEIKWIQDTEEWNMQGHRVYTGDRGYKSGGEAAVQRYWVLGIQDTEEDRAGTPGMLVIEDTRVEVRLVQRYWVLGIQDTEEDRAGTPGMLVIEDTRVEVRLVQRYWVLGILDTEV